MLTSGFVLLALIAVIVLLMTAFRIKAWLTATLCAVLASIPHF
jgi:hypothetical protein